jgi:Bacterial Ig-like domain (group 3)/FG-GAP-like repeat
LYRCKSKVEIEVPMIASSTGPRIALVRLNRIALLVASIAIAIPASAQTATTTTLAVTSGGSAATSVSSGTVVTLTATVMAASTPVTPGQVEFCDASVSYCTDIHQLGMAQLTASGKAVFKFRPGGGSHTYKAIFLGTKTYAKSSSSASSLDVTGPFITVTGISATVTSGSDWTLKAKVSSGIPSSGTPSPTGTVSFLDTSNSNADLATVPLIASGPELGFAKSFSFTQQPAAVADFNQDGIPDVVDFYNNILLGNGDGTFPADPGQGAFYGASGIAVADFNSSGYPGIAETLTGATDTIQVILGNGTGSQVIQTPCDQNGQFLGCGNQFIASADFNGDGIPDLIFSSGGYPYTLDFGVEVLLGNGDGTFGNPVWGYGMGIESAPVYVAIGDFNHDGIPDLALTDLNHGTIDIFIGNGDGTFPSEPTTLPSANSPQTISVADFRGNGILDLAVANGGNNSVSIFLGKGDGTFTAGQTLPISAGADSTAVGDFNGDGIPDLAVGNASSTTVTILLGKGDGTFTVNNVQGTSQATAGIISSADLNGDGVPDLIGAGAATLTQSGNTSTATAANVVAPGSGTHLAEASYPGDSNYGRSTSGTVNVAPVQLAAMISPVPGSVLGGSAAQFSWTTGSNVSAYLLSVGTTGQGSSNILSFPPITYTSTHVSGIPENGATLYITLSSEVNGVWEPQYYTYTEATSLVPPMLTSPTPGSQLSGSSVTFTWTPGNPVSAYQIVAGTYGPGYFNLGGSPQLSGSTTSYTLTNLPTDGKPVYITLRYQINGVWQTTDYTYTAAPLANPPAMLSPTSGSVLPGSSVTFTWQPSNAVTAYSISAGTYGPGYFNLGGSPQLPASATSYTLTNLPTDGKPVYITLRYLVNGAVWQTADYTYTAAPLANPPAITSPTPGSVLSGSSVTFTWQPSSAVTAYSISAGTYGPGYFNLGGSPQLPASATSYTLTNIPTNGKPVYITLRYLVNGAVWQTTDYTYTASQ